MISMSDHTDGENNFFDFSILEIPKEIAGAKVFRQFV